MIPEQSPQELLAAIPDMQEWIAAQIDALTTHGQVSGLTEEGSELADLTVAEYRGLLDALRVLTALVAGMAGGAERLLSNPVLARALGFGG